MYLGFNAGTIGAAHSDVSIFCRTPSFSFLSKSEASLTIVTDAPVSNSIVMGILFISKDTLQLLGAEGDTAWTQTISAMSVSVSVPSAARTM